MIGGRVPLRSLAGVLVLAAALLAVLAEHGVCVLHAAPLIALVLPLLRGRYVGERRIAALAARLRPAARRRRAPAAMPALGRTTRVRVRCGGLLVATARGTRGPPVVCA